MGSLDDAIPYEIWSEEERLQHKQHVRLYYFLKFMQEQGEDMDDDLSIPVPPSEIVKQ